MKEQKNDRRSRYTKRFLKESLIELMEEKPINKISVSELCDKADINRSTFYNHYSDQYDLLQQMEEEIIDDVNAMLADCEYQKYDSKLMQILAYIFEYIRDNSRACRILLSEQGDVHFQKQILMIAHESYVTELVTRNRLEEDTATDIYLFIVNGSIGLIQSWLKNGMKKSAHEMAELIVRLSGGCVAPFVRKQ